MELQTLDDLVRDLRQRRMVGDRPAALLLGAGASVEAGIGAMKELMDFVGCRDFDAFVAYISPRTAPERFRLLAQFLQTQRPQEVTQGYRSLASLCEEGYFDLVLTTNLDPLLDDALAAARLWRKDYLLLVNGIVRPERLGVLLRSQAPRLKVLKLHGDLFHRYMAWTPAEMDAYVQEIHEQLEEALDGRDLLVVGHRLADPRIFDLVRRVIEREGVVWYTHPSEAPAALANFAAVRAVVDPRCAFETLFSVLLSEVEGVSEAPVLDLQRPAGMPLSPRPKVPTQGAPSRGLSIPWPRFGLGRSRPSPPREPEPLQSSPGLSVADDRAQTLDDLKAAVVAIGDIDGHPSATGFLIREPRCIVCDRFPVDALGHDTVRIRTSRGETHEVPVLKKLDGSPFGPVALAAPSDLRAPALEVDPAQVATGDRVRVAVAAGEYPGVSSGEVGDARTQSISVDPVGKVGGLIRLTVAVPAGSSGAPVVDAAYRVRGFIAAGRSDLKRPESWMDPASRWFDALRGDALPSPRKPRRKR